jgi:Rrf2 family protein
MAANSKFAVAIHIMTGLAHRRGELVTSQELASSVNTNPVVIRRILSQLHKGGLITAQSGKTGGAALARPAADITLFDIYKVIEGGDLFAIPDKPENKACMVACNMKRLLGSVFSKTESAIEKSLKTVKLSDLVNEVPGASIAAA